MFTIDEIRENLAGAWMVMNGDADGLRRLDTSVEGFWRSFGAIILIVPVFVLSIMSEARLAQDIGDLPVQALTVPVQSAILMVDWMLFPGLMALVARPIGLAQQYVPFIVARNWSAVLVNAIYAVPLLIYLAGLMPFLMMALSTYIVLAASGFFFYRIARTTLAVSPGFAVGLVVADFGLSFLIRDIARALVA